MKSKIFFLPLILLLLSFSTFAQEPENGSFEDISCKMSSGCDIFYFYDGCMGPRWHNANRQPRVLENECVFDEFETPFGDKVLQVSGGAQGELFPIRYGDALFYDLDMWNDQSLELTFWGKTHYWDAWVGLEFYAVEEIEESTGTTLNLFPLKYIDLIGGYDLPVASHEWQEYTVSLSLNNQQSPISLPASPKYKHLMVVANHQGWGQVPAVAYLDNFSIDACTYDSEATIYHHIDEEDCGNIDFILDCDLTNVSNMIWDFGDDSELVQTTSTDISHLYQYAGEYTATLIIVNEDGCIDELTALIKVSCNRCTGMEAAFEHELESQTEVYTYNPETGQWEVTGYNCNYQFTDLSTASLGHNIVSWQWDFGNGTTSTAQNPTKTFGSGATYTICLSIEDDQQCTDTFCEVLETCTGRVDVSDDQRSGALDTDEMVWSVSPNPFQESVTITLPDLDESASVFLQIYDTKGGKIFQQKNLSQGQSSLDLQELNPGLYFLVMRDHYGKILFQEQIIKQ